MSLVIVGISALWAAIPHARRGNVRWARAGLFGAGLGWMYVAAGRGVVAPIVARIAFVGGAVILEGLKVIG